MEQLPAPARETGREMVVATPASVSLAESASTSEVLQRIKLVHQVLNEAMVKDVHYGAIPGTGKRVKDPATGQWKETEGKPSLLKPGAEKLCALFHLAAQPKVTVSDLGNGHREYSVQVDLIHYLTGKMVGSGIGSCSTLESKYRYKSQYNKQTQEKTRHENPDIADVYNTVLKMAKKRALVDATLTATGASDFFTQDVEDGGILPETEPSYGQQRKQPDAPEPQPEPEPRDVQGVLSEYVEAARKDGYNFRAKLTLADGSHYWLVTGQPHLGKKLALFNRQQVKAAVVPGPYASRQDVVEVLGLDAHSLAAAARAKAKANHEGPDDLHKELGEAEMAHLGKIMHEDGVGEELVLKAVKELGWDNRNPESLRETRAGVLRTIVNEWTAVVAKVRDLENGVNAPAPSEAPELVEVGVEE